MPGIRSGEALSVAAAISGTVRLSAFRESIGRGGDVTADGDICTDGPIEIGEGVSTVDLKGHTVRSTGGGPVLRITGGKVTLTGGTVAGGSGKDCNAVAVESGAELTISGGTYSVGPDADNAGNSCVYSKGGNITVTGGTFSSDGVFKDRHWVLNVKDGSGGVITVSGGRFKDFDPSDPGTGPGEIVVAEGRKVTKNGDFYEVGVATVRKRR